MVSDCAFQYVAEHVDAPQLTSSFEATINKFDKNFSAHLLDLLARLSLYSTSDCEHSMASVLSRWVRAASAHRRGPSCAHRARGPSLHPRYLCSPTVASGPLGKERLRRGLLGRSFAPRLRAAAGRLRSQRPVRLPVACSERAVRGGLCSGVSVHQHALGRPVSAPAPAPSVLDWVSLPQHLAP